MNENQLMTREQYHQSILDIIYLSSCALQDKIPEKDRLEKMNFGELYAISQFHSMTAIVAMALEEGGVLSDGAQETWKGMPERLASAWREAKAKAVRKNILLDIEREKLFRYLDKAGIWYMPLKGSILKDLYPKSGMRQMADNDILYDAQYQMKLNQYMTGQGYCAVSVNRGNHDIYEKQPIYNFELHTSLFGFAHDEKWRTYYEHVHDRLIRNGGDTCGCHFTDEDFYLYMMVHACKHHRGSGTGLRSLMDCYVYVWKKGSGLNWSYIESEAKKLGIFKFEKECRKLSNRLFSDTAHLYNINLSEAEQKLFYACAGSGTYGTTENRIKNNLKAMQPGQDGIRKETKWRYILHRAFPGAEWFQTNYPFCDRHHFAVPFFCIARIVCRIVQRGANIRAELRVVRNTK